MVKKTTLVCSLLVLLLGTAWAEEAPQGVKVVAEGYSYLGDDASIKEARTKAMAEAERAALEQGVPIYLESYTKVRNYQVDIDEIRSRLQGYIKNKKVLLDELDKEDLKYKVKIEAVVVYAEKEEKEKESAQKEEPAQKEDVLVVDEEYLQSRKKPSAPIPVETASEPRRNYRVQTPTALEAFPIGSCSLTQKQLEPRWRKAEKLHLEHPGKYIALVELLYPNIRPRRVIDHLMTIRRHNPRKFERIWALIFPNKPSHKVDLRRHDVRKRVNKHLARIKDNNPNKYIQFMHLALPRLDLDELRSRLWWICNNRPHLMQEIEHILGG